MFNLLTLLAGQPSPYEGAPFASCPITNGLGLPARLVMRGHGSPYIGSSDVDLIQAMHSMIERDATLMAALKGGNWTDLAPEGTKVPYLAMREVASTSIFESVASEDRSQVIEVAVVATSREEAEWFRRRVARALRANAPIRLAASIAIALLRVDSRVVEVRTRGFANARQYRAVVEYEGVIDEPSQA